MQETLTKRPSNPLVDRAVAEIGEIATLPEVTVRISQIVENPKSTARDLHDVIKNDPALSARILKVVNSAFYGLPGQIASIDRAIVLLGLSAVKNIAIAASMTRLFNGGSNISGFTGLELWKHSVAVGVASRMLASSQGKPAVEECFLTGLIVDLGLLVERQVFPEKLGEVIRQHAASDRRFCEIETEIIGADHQAFGMALANRWRFPRALCNVIGYHHKPAELAEVNREQAILVNIADILSSRAGIGFCAMSARESYTEEMLAAVQLEEPQIAEVAEELPQQVAMTEAIFSE